MDFKKKKNWKNNSQTIIFPHLKVDAFWRITRLEQVLRDLHFYNSFYNVWSDDAAKDCFYTERQSSCKWPLFTIFLEELNYPVNAVFCTNASGETELPRADYSISFKVALKALRNNTLKTFSPSGKHGNWTIGIRAGGIFSIL